VMANLEYKVKSLKGSSSGEVIYSRCLRNQAST
jgi:hypothetical protein